MIQLKREWIKSIASERSWNLRGVDYRFELDLGTLGDLTLKVFLDDKTTLLASPYQIRYMEEVVWHRAILEFNRVLDEMPLVGLS